MLHGKRKLTEFLTTLAMVVATASDVSTSAQAPEDRALDLVSQQFLWRNRYQYVMGGAVRFLLFWVGKDDVGGGYVLLGQGAEDPSLEGVKLVFGSAPEKAPRQINLWGVATEVVQRGSDLSHRTSAFFGFRKRTEDEVPERANALRPNAEAGPERALGFVGASLNYNDSQRVFGRSTRFFTQRDFALSELEEVEQMVISRITEVEGQDRNLTAEERQTCERVPGFLVTLKEMTDEIVRDRAPSIERCYFYNARLYTISVTSVSLVARHVVRIEREGGERIEQAYPDLVQARFQVLNHETGEKTSFTLLVGTAGPWRGVPIRVVYRPSWWIQIFLNLESVAAETATSPPPAVQR